MADRRLTMDLILNAKSVREGAQTMKQLADNTALAARAQKVLKQEMTATDIALERLKKKEKELAVQREMKRINRTNVGAGGADLMGGGGGGFMGRMFGRGVGGLIRGLGVAGMAVHAGRAISGSFKEDVANGNVGWGSFGRAGLAGIESLDPTGLLQGARLAEGNATQNYASQQAARGEFERNLRDQKHAMFEPVRDAQRTAQNSRLEAAAARGFANQVGANAGSYITENRQGVSNEATGAARLAADEARANAKAAQDIALAEQAKLDQAQAAARDASAAAKAYSGEVGKQRNRVADMTASASSASYRNETNLEDAKRTLADREQNLLEKQRLENEKLVELQKQQVEAHKAKQAAMQATLAAEKASLEVAKNRLDVVNSEKQVLEGRARQFAEMSSFEQQAAVEAARKLGGGASISSLTPEERKYVQGTQAYQDAALREGANNPLFQQFNQAVGDRDLGTVSAEAKQLAADIAKQNAELNAKFKEDMATANEEFATNLADTIKQLFTSIETKLRTEFAQGQLTKTQQEKPR